MDRYEAPVNSLWECDNGSTYILTSKYEDTVTLTSAYDGSEVLVLKVEDFEDQIHGDYYTYVGMNW